MKALLLILEVVLRIVLPECVRIYKERSTGNSETGAPATPLKDALRAKVLVKWGSVLILVLVFGGCQLAMLKKETRTVYVPDGTPVRLRATIEKAPVWVLDKDGIPIESIMDIPEGWFALPVDSENSEVLNNSEK
jgi:predicted secreted protein